MIKIFNFILKNKKNILVYGGTFIAMIGWTTLSAMFIYDYKFLPVIGMGICILGVALIFEGL